jgi:Putative auto-transporter adhesin, head GIN domain
MKTSQKTLLIAFSIFILTGFSSCIVKIDDPLPAYREQEQYYYLKNFDQLNMGSAFVVNVYQGNTFQMQAIGDEQDLDDLDVYVRNGVLYARYVGYSSRRYKMTINITMPSISEVDFSGASDTYIEGFSVRYLNVFLSGSSRLKIDSDVQNLNFNVAGASQLNMIGDGEKIIGEVSGASQVNNFSFVANEQTLSISGASKARINVLRFLRVAASGASNVRYRGNPTLEKSISGASVVERD